MNPSKSLLAAALLVGWLGCSKKESTESKPVTCHVAGQMVTKRLGEFADQSHVTGDKRAKLDERIASAVTARCTADKWDDLPLSCLGAMASIKEGEISVDNYRKGVDICVDAIGKESKRKLDDDVGAAIRSIKEP